MENKCQIFWRWFISKKEEIANAVPGDGILRELDERINDLGNFAWELSSGKTARNALTISPGGDRSIFNEVKEIISQAPQAEDWEFYDSKQIKDWKYEFSVIIDGQKINVNVSKWEYVLLKYDTGPLDIIVRPYPYLSILGNNMPDVVEMVLDSLVGENERLDKIDRIHVESEFNSDIIGSKTSILNLKEL